MSLRRLEEKKKFKFYKLKSEEKWRIIKLLSEALRERKEILIAALFGSFLNFEMFRDIDIAIFTGYKIPYNKVEAYEEELSRNLELIAGIPIDIVVIDYAPPQFRIKALDGTILVEREPALSLRLQFKSHQEIKDLRAKIYKFSQAIELKS